MSDLTGAIARRESDITVGSIDTQFAVALDAVSLVVGPRAVLIIPGVALVVLVCCRIAFGVEVREFGSLPELVGDAGDISGFVENHRAFEGLVIDAFSAGSEFGGCDPLIVIQSLAETIATGFVYAVFASPVDCFAVDGSRCPSASVFTFCLGEVGLPSSASVRDRIHFDFAFRIQAVAELVGLIVGSDYFGDALLLFLARSIGRHQCRLDGRTIWIAPQPGAVRLWNGVASIGLDTNTSAVLAECGLTVYADPFAVFVLPLTDFVLIDTAIDGEECRLAGFRIVFHLRHERAVGIVCRSDATGGVLLHDRTLRIVEIWSSCRTIRIDRRFRMHNLSGTIRSDRYGVAVIVDETGVSTLGVDLQSVACVGAVFCCNARGDAFTRSFDHHVVLQNSRAAAVRLIGSF